MKKIFVIDDTLSNKISYYHMVVFLVMLPFDRFYSQLVLISFALHTLIHLRKNVSGNFLWKDILIVQSVFWLTVVGMLYTKNSAHAGSMMSRQLAIFIFPLLIYFTNLDINKYLDRLMKVFALVCTGVLLYLYVDAFRIISYNNLPLTSITSPVFLNQNFSSPIGLHATYLSLYIALSLVYLTTLLFRSPSLIVRAFIVLQFLFMLTGLVQLGSRTVFVTTVLLTAFVFPVLNLKGRARKNYVMASALILSLVGLMIFKIPGLKARFLSNLAIDLGAKHSYSIDDPRIERWKLAVKIIGKSPIFGHGSGDELDLLNESYFSNQLYNSYLFNLNAHNEYLSILIKNGILGLLIYLATLGYGLFRALRNRDIVFSGFLLLLIMLSFSENFLDVNKGIFFYAFFFSVFMKSGTRTTGMDSLTTNKKSVSKASAK